jgi:hypothetical protein
LFDGFQKELIHLQLENLLVDGNADYTLGLQKRKERESWLCRTGIDSKHFSFIGSVLTDLATTSLYRGRPCADMDCVIVLSAGQQNNSECH